MSQYAVDISPDAKREFMTYLDGASEYGEDSVMNLLDAFDACIEVLENTPYAGSKKLRYIPVKYKMLHLWRHYWIIYQVYEDEKTVKIEYVIDDRQNYGEFVH